MNMIQSAKDQIAVLTRSAYRAAVQEGLLPDGVETVPAVEIPKDTANGDYTTTFCLAASKAMRKNPREVANILTQHMKLDGTYFTSVEIAGPGFLNFRLGEKWYADVVEDVEREADAYGRGEGLKGKKYMVEFVSANPTGPMHMGNARGGVLGDTLASVLDWSGANVWREFYVNDFGNQIEKFATSLEVRYLQHFDPSVEMPEDAYHGADITEHAENFIAENGDKYVNTDAKTRRDALVAFALPKNIAGLERDLKKYRIVYDNWFRESTLHQNGQVKWVVDELTKRGYTYEQEGAVWFKATDFGADKDFVLVRANGIPTYVVPDIAYHYNKLMVRKFDKAIDILGADHHGYVPRLKAALTALGADAARLDVVLMQMVMLMRDGEVVKLSKRSGKAITLVTLLDEIPLDAARFFFNTRESNSHFEFDLDLAVEQSSQNPVYYVQYAHARICSLLRAMAEEGLTLEQCDHSNLSLLTQPQELELIRHLAALPSELDAAAKAYDPSKVTKYATELATLFHKFYDVCSIKYAETPELKQARLLLCEAARQGVANTLQILKVTCPEKM